jgi:hypothetical protein
MRVIRLKHAVQNAPVDIRARAVKRNFQLFANHGRRSVTTHQELCIHLLFCTSTRVPQNGTHWMGSALVYLESAEGSTALDQRFVPYQVTDVNPLDLALRDDVKAAPVARVGLMRWFEEQFLAIFVDCCSFNQRPFLVHFLSETPCRQGLKEPWLHSIRSPSYQMAIGVVCED